MIMEPCSNAFLFSVQRALPEEMPAELSAVAVDTDEKTLCIRCYFQGPVTETGVAFMDYLKEAVWADFFPTIHVEVEGLSADLEDHLPGGTLAWRRPVRELVHA